MTQFADRKDYRESSQRLITGLAWSVPSVELRDNKWLVCGGNQATERLAKVPAGGLLRRFCRLAKARPQEITKFAQDYGLLRLCQQHSLPQWHAPDCNARTYDKKLHEPCDDIEDWRRWAKRFVGTTEMAGAILKGEAPRSQDVDDALGDLGPHWDSVANFFRRPAWLDFPMSDIGPDGNEVRTRLPWELQPPKVQIFALIQWVNALLAMAHVGSRLVQPLRQHRLAIVDGFSEGTPLFGALVIEVAAVCARVRAIARCQHCRDSFIPTRTSAVYCRKCGRQKIRWRLAQRARRARFKKEGLTARGTRPRGGRSKRQIRKVRRPRVSRPK